MSPDNIRKVRLMLGESQTQFGMRFQVSQITIGYWESGRSCPSEQRLNQLDTLASNSSFSKQKTLPFRPIQYLGSKQRLAETISEVVDEIAPANGRVGDLFAGSGVVSGLLGTKRPVTAVDIQTYSKVLCRSMLLGQSEDFEVFNCGAFIKRYEAIRARFEEALAPLLEFERDAEAIAEKGDPGALIELIEFGSIAVHAQRRLVGISTKLANLISSSNNALNKSGLSPAQIIATYYFGGSYFSYRQAIGLDALYAAAHPTPHCDTAALAVILSTASELVNTVGKQFAQPMKLKKSNGYVPPILLERALRDRNLDTLCVAQDWANRWNRHSLGGNFDHRIVCSDVADFMAGDHSCGVYYADPPYTIDHYSRFYHVLETLSLRDTPHLAEMKKKGQMTVMRGIYRADRYQSPYCVPSKAPIIFERLFSDIGRKKIPLVMSYSPFDENEGQRSRLLTMGEIISIAKRHFRNVSLIEVDEHSHRKLNSRASNSGIRSDAERLLICEAGT